LLKIMAASGDAADQMDHAPGSGEDILVFQNAMSDDDDDNDGSWRRRFTTPAPREGMVIEPAAYARHVTDDMVLLGNQSSDDLLVLNRRQIPEPVPLARAGRGSKASSSSLPDIPPRSPPAFSHRRKPNGPLRVFWSPAMQKLGCLDPCLTLLECAAAVCPDACRRLGLGGVAEAEVEGRKWFRVHPIGDMNYYVRRDKGPERTCTPAFEKPASLKDKKKYHQSTPHMAERTVGMGVPAGFDRDAFTNHCRICFEKEVEIVLLPCRHGGLCKECFRATLFRLPAHRGGRMCPFCRVKIRQAVQLYHESGAAVQYGFAIDVC